MKKIYYENVLVVGAGTREDVFIWALNKGRKGRIGKIYCVPGNPGMEEIAYCVDLDIMDNEKVRDFCMDKKIGLVIIGPEAPLANGLVDVLEDAEILVFGPSKKAAQLESSKIFARLINDECGIPQPRYEICSSKNEAKKAARKFGFPEKPTVIKYESLASGKGVIVCKNQKEFKNALARIFDKKIFGDIGKGVLVEEFLDGKEVTIIAACKGTQYIMLGSAGDHKRIFDDDQGPNTGGMGAYSPSPLADKKLLKFTGKRIVKPILKKVKKLGHPFYGFLYVGLMVVNGKAYVIEYNVRMGDPECQVIIPRLLTPLIDVFEWVAKRRLLKPKVRFSDRTAIMVVLAAAGYPEKDKYEEVPIIINPNNPRKLLLFHGGTKREDGQLKVAGGRVISAGLTANCLECAINEIYELLEKNPPPVDFEGMNFRKDIGLKALKFLEDKCSP